MAYKNRFMTDWTPEKFIERATNVGEDTRKYIINILEKTPASGTSLPFLQGILSFASKVVMIALIKRPPGITLS